MSLQPDPADGFVPVRELADATEQVLADFADTTVRNPELWLYRERTVALLRRYLRISIEVGRLPSLLGRELFRSKVTSYRMSSFEDAVIFVYDVERAVDQLDGFSKEILAAVVFQDCTQDEAAELLGCARRTICREFPQAVDRITELFLEGGLLNRLSQLAVEKTCQGGESALIGLTPCKQAEYIYAKDGTISFSKCYSENRGQKERAFRCALFVFRGDHAKARFHRGDVRSRPAIVASRGH